MTFSAVIRCGRDWTPGDPCRQAEPVGVIRDFTAGRRIARAKGWTTVFDPDTLDVIDRCPACTRRETEGGTRRRAGDRRPVDDCALPCHRPGRVR